MTISSPGYPRASYPKEARCVWDITVSPEYYISVGFADMDIEISHGCIFDYVQFQGKLIIKQLLFFKILKPYPFLNQKIISRFFILGKFRFWICFKTTFQGDGDYESERYCGKGIKIPNTNIHENNLKIIFQSDENIEKRGFYIYIVPRRR